MVTVEEKCVSAEFLLVVRLDNYQQSFARSFCQDQSIGLARNFLRFFRKISFYFLTSRIQLGFNNVCTITIYDLSPTHGQRKDPGFVKVLRLLVKEVG